ncbi:kinase-like domain-containing protein [Rhizophagus irregularis DAOM 181602=DAOM 197198]|uniref:Kinase-like domain-containing protein n=1 Tax=Rhizophagus irregularis (strain DAOM 181602 / DAOM 197198 / MUCL 43194) TaxID=747089 RepID=A0A2P4Q904_RHIID|nr:kinase-like domain-containing protein [Rhizophagus irregularis DAOM 181602=DAOM 197198]POG74125.1 kinase-like domain-containing protein [Rhizophagus irregularis DAOM 181602=DAOM 197198]|eukprot:XP_025180991.1 kinase-like domain-containing protein [Rhizophagus irregularis DAOM 181602=DAOM 197198]
MSDIRYELVNAAINRAITSIDYNIYDDFHKQHEFKKQTILANNSLTNDEKTYAIKNLNKTYDKNKIFYNEGTRRTCENCNQECLATLYCEYCVQNYLKANFSNWTSGNNDIDNLIQKCQIETLRPDKIIEWIPYNNLQNIEYLTKGGFSEIYTADWIDGGYEEWDSKEQKLIRFGRQNVILKGLENVESANQRWFEEVESHLKISNKWPQIVQCYGLTQNSSNGNYMLVINIMDIDLRKYIQQTQNQLLWKERIKIAYDITLALKVIHRENAIHRDLHSGNILYSELNQNWRISDLGFCGPADKSTESIYGNLPYIAPEVISGKNTTIKSDIYSIGMLLWEISSGQPPFNYYENDYKLALNIINGMRPKVISGTPLKYENLMKQCWDADPSKRPDINTLEGEIYALLQYYQNISDEILQQETNINLEKNILINNTMSKHINSKLFTSKIHQFKNLPEPKNAAEEEQEAFHSKSYDCFNIPDNIEDFNNSSNQNYACNSKASSILKDDSKSFNELQIKSNNDNQINYGKEIVEQQQIKQYNLNIEDEDETYDDKNFHSEEDDVFEIPDGKYFTIMFFIFLQET